MSAHITPLLRSFLLEVFIPRREKLKIFTMASRALYEPPALSPHLRRCHLSYFPPPCSFFSSSLPCLESTGRTAARGGVLAFLSAQNAIPPRASGSRLPPSSFWAKVPFLVKPFQQRRLHNLWALMQNKNSETPYSENIKALRNLVAVTFF